MIVASSSFKVPISIVIFTLATLLIGNACDMVKILAFALLKLFKTFERLP